MSASFATAKASAFTTGGTSLTTRGKKSSTNNGCVFCCLFLVVVLGFVLCSYSGERDPKCDIYPIIIPRNGLPVGYFLSARALKGVCGVPFKRTTSGAERTRFALLSFESKRGIVVVVVLISRQVSSFTNISFFSHTPQKLKTTEEESKKR